MVSIFRSTLIKLAVIVICLAFLLEVFAFQRNQSGSTTPETNDTEEGPSTVGAGYGNVTIVSYGDSLGSEVKVYNYTPEAKSIAASLVSRGLALYYSETPSGALVINLPRGSNISAIASELEGLNLPMRTRALVRFTAPVTFTTDAGPVTLEVGSLYMELDPGLPAGRLIPVRVQASISGGRAVDKYVEPYYNVEYFYAPAAITGLTGHYVTAGFFAWENRSFDAAAIATNLSGQFSNFSFLPLLNNSVGFLRPLNATEFESLKSLNLSYVSSVDSSSASIANNFTDKQKLSEDFSAALPPEIAFSLSYPYSLMRMEFIDNASRTSEQIEGILNASMPSASLVDIYRYANVALNKTVVNPDSGLSYRVLPSSVLVPVTPDRAVNDTLQIYIKARTFSDFILSYEYVP
ncbi:MAG: hypothetical protein NT157_04765 [Candidatus Micrarchaeota archaeon]|nr:hypothetical protein [Candidatus Micrarchaeota archaeon]